MWVSVTMWMRKCHSILTVLLRVWPNKVTGSILSRLVIAVGMELSNWHVQQAGFVHVCLIRAGWYD